MLVLSTSPNKTGKHRWHDSAISSPAAYQRLGLTPHDRLKEVIIFSDVTNIDSLRLVERLEEIPNATHDSFFARKPLTGLQRFKIMGEAGISDTVLVENRTMDYSSFYRLAALLTSAGGSDLITLPFRGFQHTPSGIRIRSARI
jgi:hypothetical protein